MHPIAIRMTLQVSTQQTINWTENGIVHTAQWRSETGAPAPKRIIAADDTMKADVAYRLACEGTAILWRGDYHNARQLLQAMGRRIDRKTQKPAATLTEAFHLQRQSQAQRARTLGMLLLPFNADHSLPLRRAPDVRDACTEAYGPASEPYVTSLRELLGLIGAHEWRKKGVNVAALHASIHPHYGVFAPVRNEYIDLVAQAPLPSTDLAFDIGTGTGVLAALLATRGVKNIVATDLNPRALECARDNIGRLGLTKQVSIIQTDLFPQGRAPLIVCNPPWVPARPNSPLEEAVYDPDSRMLKGFLAGLASHLTKHGEGWLIFSDLAEHLGLRSREQLLEYIAEAGLQVVAKLDARPVHPRAADRDDPLFAARTAEVTSLWRLTAQ